MKYPYNSITKLHIISVISNILMKRISLLFICSKNTLANFSPLFFKIPISVKCFKHLSAALWRSPKFSSKSRLVMHLFTARYSLILANNSSSVYWRVFDENLARSNRAFLFTSLSSSASGRNLMLRTLI